MRIAFCHNFYQQPGGEDQVFQAESAMMEEHGHDVLRYTRHNDEINDLSKLSVLKKTFWNGQVYKELLGKFQQFRPDVVHFTNTFPLISPSAYKAARRSGAVVVQSLHNYRLICPGSLLMRNGSVCETCVNKTFALPAIWRKCYRGSMFASAVTVGMNAWHRVMGTSRKYVNRFISLTDFAKQKFIESGFDPDRISVKQNFVRGVSNLASLEKNGRALFVGRLVNEKGIELLLDAWSRLPRQTPLDIVGDGPLREQVESRTKQLSHIKLHGNLDHSQVKEMMRSAMVQIVPSICYETFGLVVIEAFSVGTPAIVTNHGALAELVEDGRTGLRFESGNAAELAQKVDWITREDSQRTEMGSNALAEYELKYTREKNYEILKGIYEETLELEKVS